MLIGGAGVRAGRVKRPCSAYVLEVMSSRLELYPYYGEPKWPRWQPPLGVTVGAYPNEHEARRFKFSSRRLRG